MTMKLSAAVLAFTFAATNAFAQGGPQGQPPKASKAEVQKLVNSIKSDPQKMTQYCAVLKIQDQYAAAGKDQKKIQELDKQYNAASAKLGPDFDKITNSDLDDASGALLEDLSKGCK